jgi:hypothetical protein
MQMDPNNPPGLRAALPGDQTHFSLDAGSPSPERSPVSSEPANSRNTSIQMPKSSAAAMAALDHTVTGLLSIDPQAMTGAGALEMLEQLARQRRRLEAVWLQAVATADQLDATAVAGSPATLQQHLASGTGAAPGRAKADIEAARAVHGEPSRELIRTPKTNEGPLASMGELLANGDISAAHVDTGVKTLEQVPERLSTAENLTTITGFLVHQAPSTTPKQIKALASRLIRNLEPDTDDHYDPDAYLRRSFTMNTDITGMVHGTYQLDPAAGAELMAILNPLAAPHPGQKDEHGNIVARDERKPAQRRADAFSELIRAAATHLGPVNHAPPSANNGDPAKVESGSDAEKNGIGPGAEANHPRGGANGAGPTGPGLLGHGQADTALVPPIADLFTLFPTDDTKTLAGRTVMPKGNKAPEQPGNKAPGSRAGKLRLTRRQNRVSIVTTMDQIKTLQDRRTGRRRPVDPTDSHCEQTGPISPGTLARMSCDALFERVVLDAKGALLDLGLPTRLASPAQRRAVAIRDGGCFGPGCNRPSTWCELHHVIWYSHDGPTDISNLAPGCASHHGAVHAGLLEVAMIDGIPYTRVTAKGAKTCGTTMPLGVVAHPKHTGWIRNSYFDQLKAADNAARAITIPADTDQRQRAA